MSLEISFALSDKDLEHFKIIMKETVERAGKLSDEEVLSKAKEMCQEVEGKELPDFVSTRMESLSALISAVEDEEWQMPEDEKQDIMYSLAYFSEPHDLVPDNVPVLGYVDDAIMIELVVQDMSLDLKAYREFCSYRTTEENRRGDAAQVDRESWLAGTRNQIRTAMRRDRNSNRRKRLFSRIM